MEFHAVFAKVNQSSRFIRSRPRVMTRSPARRSNPQFPRARAESARGFLVLPGGELWWLGLGGHSNSSLVPVKGSNELTLFGATSPNGARETGIVMVSAADDVKEHAASDHYPYHRRRTARVSFTCDLCMTRNEHRPINPAAYQSGSIFVRCNGCDVTHKLVDNLGIFQETYEVFPPPELRRHFLEKELYERIKRLRDE